ncbi:glutathione-specific gamma-glutamylcyclotransferase 1 [Bacillus rossius redtenbacheri]|uniref:glutathione-specific gamma-glutamylcyclotransferase 1 n=1 Tax=Bacillus rossius redtenbacheri TaxID=93214 RepID=UPI002FDECACA
MQPAGDRAVWVFGYGSLCWHPGFEYDEMLTGFVRGFCRKFWQGNTTHRGTEDKPGRVATLVEEKGAVVWGRAFRLRGEAALPYLEAREVRLGGYEVRPADFHPADGKTAPFAALAYVATPGNRHWLGDAPLPLIAAQIADSCGASGHNVEYLVRLARFVRQHAPPEAADEHLFALEAMVLSAVKERDLCLKTLMGEEPRRLSLSPEPDQLEAEGAAALRPDTFEFTSRVPPKKLRCLNI